MVRLATPEESERIWTPKEGYETTVLILERANARGHLCLSRFAGNVIGHDLTVESDDRKAASELYFAARRILRENGETTLSVHFDPSTPERVKAFWKSIGFEPVLEIYQGNI